jgi:hypothetical protein
LGAAGVTLATTNHKALSPETEKVNDEPAVCVPRRRWKPVRGSVNLRCGQLASWREISEGK